MEEVMKSNSNSLCKSETTLKPNHLKNLSISLKERYKRGINKKGD